MKNRAAYSMKNKVAYLGMFTALALVFSYVEALVPLPIGVPGAKLGLANTVVVFVMYKANARTAWVISALRVVLAGFLFGSLASLIYALCGAMASWGVMSLAKKYLPFSIFGVSVLGAVTHNIAQIAVASVVVGSSAIFGYLPILLIVGTVTGLVIGSIAQVVLRTVKTIPFGKGSHP